MSIYEFINNNYKYLTGTQFKKLCLGSKIKYRDNEYCLFYNKYKDRYKINLFVINKDLTIKKKVKVYKEVKPIIDNALVPYIDNFKALKNHYRLNPIEKMYEIKL